MPSRLALLLALAAALSACQGAAPPPPPPPGLAGAGVTPSTFRLPAGAGCAGEVARFRAVLENDLATGHLTQAVHDRALRDVERASASCAAGREGEARSILGATRSRFGYPA